MPDTRLRDRLRQLETNISEIWTYKTVLYVGANAYRFHFSEQLRGSNCKVDVLEIAAEKCTYLRTMEWLNNVIHGDVTEIDINKKYELVLWSHGPNMIERKKIEPTLKKLLKITEKLIVLMTPWGKFYECRLHDPAVAVHDKSLTNDIYGNEFLSLGFRINCIGEVDTNGSNLLAWKYI